MGSWYRTTTRYTCERVPVIYQRRPNTHPGVQLQCNLPSVLPCADEPECIHSCNTNSGTLEQDYTVCE
jgi:hypothetical protein